MPSEASRRLGWSAGCPDQYLLLGGTATRLRRPPWRTSGGWYTAGRRREAVQEKICIHKTQKPIKKAQRQSIPLVFGTV